MRLDAEYDCAEDLYVVAGALSQQFVTRGLSPLNEGGKREVVRLLKSFWMHHWESEMYRLGELKAPERPPYPGEEYVNQIMQESSEEDWLKDFNYDLSQSTTRSDAETKVVEEQHQGDLPPDPAPAPQVPLQALSQSSSGKKRRFDQTDADEECTDTTETPHPREGSKRRRSL